jgi:5-methylcytosine-specific restriction endonuclease McrA
MNYKKEGVRDPSSHRTPAQIRKQVEGYNARPDVQARRVKQNAARRELAREGLVRKGDGKDVDHKRPLHKGGGNARSNLRVVSRSRNRGWADGSV